MAVPKVVIALAFLALLAIAAAHELDQEIQNIQGAEVGEMDTVGGRRDLKTYYKRHHGYYHYKRPYHKYYRYYVYKRHRYYDHDYCGKRRYKCFDHYERECDCDGHHKYKRYWCDDD